MPEFDEGDLCIIGRQQAFTLCYTGKDVPPSIRECPVKELEVPPEPHTNYRSSIKNLEGKLALIVYVSRNRLDQTVGYRVLIEGKEMFCKSKVAEKYLKLAETTGDESR
tara:strand:- start:195 stop:521 length:327 start_codon:yes stop_codon:yes gene_type:complete